MSKIKITYCIPALYNPGGMERIITEKINFLMETGRYNISVITTEQRGRPCYFKLHDEVVLHHLSVNFDEAFSLPLFSKFRVVKGKLKLYKSLLTKIIETENTDICISTGGKELEFLSSMNVQCKKVLEMHFAKNFREQFLLARKNSLINKILGKIRTKQLEDQTKKLDAVVVLTKEDQKDWEKTHKNIYQIYNFSAITSNQFPDYNKKRAIAIGKLDPQKGFDMLIDAWSLRKNDLSDWTLDIFGQGDWEELLKEKIKIHGLENNIFLRGVTQQTEQEFLKSSLFLFSSRYEGFSLVFIEAMNCGLPIISFDCHQGPSELIKNNDIGKLIIQNDISRFADAIVTLATDEALRRKMGMASKEKAMQFSKDKIMLQWEDFFQQHISKKQ